MQIQNLQIKIVQENLEANQKRIDIKRKITFLESKTNRSNNSLDQKQLSALKDHLSELHQHCEKIAHSYNNLENLLLKILDEKDLMNMRTKLYTIMNDLEKQNKDLKNKIEN
jgi:hypothetical protein